MPNTVENINMPVYHVPVLYEETLEALHIQPNGIYIDCTFGGGGHSAGILSKLGPKGQLIAFDQDEEAKANIPAKEQRIHFVPQNFKHIVDGVLADLGVSSHQFDEGTRGFSIRYDGPLDMRMDTREPLTAQVVVETYTEQQLHKIFEQFGEVTNAKTLAKHLVSERNHRKMATIAQFKSAIAPLVKGNPNKYFAQVFQALRIEVNNELGALCEMLLQLNQVVKTGGRVAIITFHSLEDRIVKQFFKNGDFELKEENPFVMENPSPQWKLVYKKPVTASAEELKKNTRSRSAKLRVAEKL
jgi:16S rRNA (cytosine1402-N4)-methyltransferase